MTESILALDQGTTSSRAMLVDASGRPAAIASAAYPQQYPLPGWVEHDPTDIIRSQINTAREVLAESGPVAALGIANQRETTLLWDRRDGRPVHNAIVWQDRARDLQLTQDVVVPIECVDVEQHRPRGVADISHVQATACQVGDKE